MVRAPTTKGLDMFNPVRSRPSILLAATITVATASAGLTAATATATASPISDAIGTLLSGSGSSSGPLLGDTPSTELVLSRHRVEMLTRYYVTVDATNCATGTARSGSPGSIRGATTRLDVHPATPCTSPDPVPHVDYTVNYAYTTMGDVTTRTFSYTVRARGPQLPGSCLHANLPASQCRLTANNSITVDHS